MGNARQTGSDDETDQEDPPPRNQEIRHQNPRRVENDDSDNQDSDAVPTTHDNLDGGDLGYDVSTLGGGGTSGEARTA
ncbi:hypothetical protein GUJ93_ZPchr0011g26993 [Zizania palustris]|uniref:Uncharacterized protein n=1 Tax=Zizania palustris TaxID=103762 RepID=A0A8J5WKX1_ZIZPA|nr:hypothetical protein GUJ93_ZPchr0011g26993 [Zizania palustris]